MSSEVQAKWMNSAARASSGSPATDSLRKYSTAFTSWLVTRSIALMRAASARPKRSTKACRKSRDDCEKEGISARLASESAISQATSTCTRQRMNAASDIRSRSGASLAA